MFDFSAHELTRSEQGWYQNPPLVFLEWRKTVFASQQKLQGVGFLANIIENHDEPRGASHYLPSHAQNEMGKKMLATTSILLRGIPFLYQGQEIGMTNCRRSSIEEYDDINTIDQYQVALAAGCSKEEALRCCYENSRDNGRTPMHWSAEANAGFTAGTPWLALNPNYTEINVAKQEEREDSVLNYYKKLIALRKNRKYKEIFTYGGFVPVYEEYADIFAFERVADDGEGMICVAANYGTECVTLDLKQSSLRGEVLLSNTKRENECRKEMVSQGTLTLKSCEVIVFC